MTMSSPRLGRRAVLAGLAVPMMLPAVARAGTAGIPSRALPDPAPSYQGAALAQAEFVNAAGQRLQFADFAKPLILFNLWAHWCGACLNELPSIRALQAAIGPANIDIVMLSYAAFWDADVAYGHRNGLGLPQWRLAPETSDALAEASFGVRDGRFGLPQSLLFAGRAKHLVRYEAGSRNWASSDSIRQARTWLASAR